jgi:hypothetical protein
MIAAALILMPSLGAAAETRVFRVLVAPAEGVPGGAFSRASDLTATLDKQPYAVRSVVPLRPGEGRTVIVLNFSETSPANHACLLAEALSALERIHESPAPVLVAAGWSTFKSRVNLGPGRDVDVWTGEDLQALTSRCESGRTPDSPHSSAFVTLQHKALDIAEPILVFNHLRKSFSSADAPVRIFWLAESFYQFELWARPLGCSPNQHAGITCEGAPAPFADIERVAEADLTLFPIVFGNRGRERQRTPQRSRNKQAADLANLTGGFMSTVSGKPGDTLLRAIERSREGTVLTLEGPVTVEGRGPAKAQTLTIQARGGDGPATWQRRFVVNREGSVKPAEYDLVPLIIASKDLGLRFGCQAPDLPAEARTMGLTLPPEVANAPPGEMDVYLDYPEESGFRGQRPTINRKQGGSGSICLPLLHARDGMRFRVMVLDRVTGWVGAESGVLSATHDGR